MMWDGPEDDGLAGNKHQARRADRLVRKGIMLTAKGRRREGLALLERGVQLNAQHPRGRLHLGMALAGEGAYDDAVVHVREALALRPESAAFHLFAGRAFFDAGDYESARDAFDRCLALSRANDLAASYKVLTEWAAGSSEAACRLDADALPDSTPFLARLLMLIESEMRGRSVGFVDKERPVPFLDRMRVAYLLWRGGLEYKRGRFGEAAELAEEALEMFPGHAAAVAFQKDCRTAALEYARRRVEEEPQSAEALIELGTQLAEAEQFEEAMERIEAAQVLLAEAPDQDLLERPEILRLRGRILYGLGRTDEALEQINAGAEPGFSMAEPHYYRGLCRLAQGGRHLCLADFEPLVAKVCWAVPLRLKEFLAWRRSDLPPRSPSEAQTSP